MDIITNYDEYMQRQPRLQPRVRCITLEHPSWVSPLYLCLDDVKGYHLCQIVKSSYKHSNFRWNVRDIQLEIQIQPPKADSRPCFNSGDMIALYNCGYQNGEDKKLSQTAGDGFDPLNNW